MKILFFEVISAYSTPISFFGGKETLNNKQKKFSHSISKLKDSPHNN